MVDVKAWTVHSGGKMNSLSPSTPTTDLTICSSSSETSWTSIISRPSCVEDEERTTDYSRSRRRGLWDLTGISPRSPPRRERPTELLGIDAKTFTFSYAELKAATEAFSPDNKLGEGGFGPVYKGTLNDGRVIVVKQLSVTSHQGKNQFITEIATISAVQHRNLVKLYGCCIEGDKRLLIGYLAPEYAMRGHLTEKADVFAFGVVALEVVSGRPNSDSSLEEEKIYLLEWTQASPTLRPSMSRVVAMLSGDIEVSTVTSRPGYLTDWKYDDIIVTSYFNSSSASTSIVVDVGNSPANASKPVLGDTIK
ncbi:probable LRR receptor-like serine/threonine-protein kinase At1g56140 [Quercus suber]|uniref:probable LRR receptor-like serine/threonine-protein kinase At1g56140 n=1 Tax=Quercus suber TaxID=58331 RepID=UPI0032DE7C33